MEDGRLERFYLSLFKTSEKRWRRIVWRANKERYGETPWDWRMRSRKSRKAINTRGGKGASGVFFPL